MEKFNEITRMVAAKEMSEKANLVFMKITEFIYKIKKDRQDSYSGIKYVSHDEVLNSLNQDLRVMIVNKKDQLIHKNF